MRDEKWRTQEIQPLASASEGSALSTELWVRTGRLQRNVLRQVFFEHMLFRLRLSGQMVPRQSECFFVERE